MESCKIVMRFTELQMLIEELGQRKQVEEGLAVMYVDSASEHVRHAAEQLRLALKLMPESAGHPKVAQEFEFGDAPKPVPFWK